MMKSKNKNKKIKTVKYVSNILMTEPFTDYTKPIFWLSKRINIDKSMYLYYQCPGGHMEKEEDQLACLYRETTEETLIFKEHLRDVNYEFTCLYDQQVANRDSGKRVVYVYTSITSIQPKVSQDEQINMTAWQLYSLRDIVLLKVIDILGEYILQLINNQQEQLLLFYGTEIIMMNGKFIQDLVQ